MRPTASTSHPLGWWRPGAARPDAAADALRNALSRLDRPVTVVDQDGALAVADGGTATLGGRPSGHALPLLGTVPALHPDQLGDPAFRAAHGLRYAYVAGAMANGISSVELVVAMGRAGMLGFFGAAGLAPTEVAQAIDRIRRELPDAPWGVNLIHTPSEPEIEQAIVALYLDRGVRCVSASAYLDLTLPLVRYRLAGIHEQDGRVVTPNRVLAKVSRSEVATKFLSPAPARFVQQLVDEGFLTADQARLAARVPMAEDVTAEADSGGHTDNRPLVVLLPRLQAVRDALQEQHRYAVVPRIGAAGGLGTPRAIASALQLGAAYVVTGSINQGCAEAGTSDRVRELLAQAGPTDVTMAPAADMFEMGVELQVLARGTMFPVKARRLYQLYKERGSLEALTADERAELERKVFKQPLEDAWASTAAFWEDRDPTQLDRAARDPRHAMALLFRSYLGLSSRWANAGVAERSIDFQIWCGPAMGAFNRWADGGRFGDWRARQAVPVARNLLVGAAIATRASALRTQGVLVPAAAERFEALSDDALDALLDREWTVAEETAAPEVVERPDAIAIVGMSCLFPQAEDLVTFWRNLRTGVDAIGEVPERDGYWRAEDYFDADPSAPDMLYTTRGGFLDPVDFDPTEFGIPPTILEATDTSQLLGLLVASRALRDAGYGPGVEWNKDRASVILGVTGTQELVVNLGARLGHPRWKKALAQAGVDADTAADVVERIARSYVSWQESSFPGLLGNVVAGRIANRLDLGGTNCVIDAACASSLGAIEMGVMELRTGRSDVVITGGVDTLNDVFMYQCFTATPALSKTGDARPFDRDGDGTILGEGIGILVLKRLADAERDGDRVHAVLTGIGSSSDGRAKSIYAPRSSGQARALRAAYSEAGVSPRDIDLVEAHGTGTKAGDATEVQGLAEVYDEAGVEVSAVALGSVKSMIGHTKAAAGAAGLIKAALALEHRVLPPTLKVRAPLPALEDGAGPFYLNTRARPWLSDRPRRAAISAFGFGGSNFHAVLEEYGQPGVSWDGAVDLWAASAEHGQALAERLRELASGTAAESRARFRSSDPARAVVVVGADEDAGAKLLAAAARAERGETGLAPDGSCVGFAAPGKLALVFPGQGSQYVGMGAELACVFPEVLEALDAEPASRAAHPPTVFSEEAAEAQESALRATDVAQPALGAVESGLLAVLRRFGVQGERFAGHSYGELVALRAAGVFDDDGLRAASAARGRLMAGNGKDRGTMLAVLAPLDQVEQVIASVGGGLVLANRNTPEQGVAAGSREAIDALEATCARQGLRTRRLSVGAAFHSPLVAEAERGFAAALQDIAVNAPNTPVFANATAQTYPADPDGIRGLLARQIARPVAWVELVQALHDDGVRTFVEVGPRRALTGMIGRIVDGARTIALDASGGRRSGLRDLALALAQIAAAGHPIDLTPWERRPAPPRAALMTSRRPRMAVPLSGANHRDPVAPLPPRAPRPAPVAPPARAIAAPTPETTMSQPTDPHTAALLVQALQGAQEQLRTLQAMQQQTAQVHQTFLAGQAAAQASFQQLLDGQHRLIEQSLGMPSRPAAFAAPAPVVAAPAPAPVAPAPTFAAPAPTFAAPAPTFAAPAPTLAAPAPTFAAPAPTRAAPSPAPVVPVAAPPAPAAPVAAASVDVVDTLLSVVAEATGYPVDMLELDMDLESDLGIDSIKRVEILSMLTERLPSAPTVEPERLGGLHTLRAVADFVRGSAPAPAAPAPAAAPVTAPVPAPVTPAPAAAPANDAGLDAAAILVAVVAEATGYPTEMLELDMDLESDLGIDSIKRVEILSMLSERLPSAPTVEPESLGGLHTLRQVLDFVAGGGAPQPEAPSPTPERRAVSAVPFVEAAADRPLPLTTTRPVWILDDGGDLPELLIDALDGEGVAATLVHADELPSDPPGGLVLLGGDLAGALTVLRAAGLALRDDGGFLLSVSRLDGGFGTIDGSAFTAGDAVQNGLAGFVKSAAWEWPGVWCRAVDVAASFDDEELPELVLAELCSAGPVEIGLAADSRRRMSLERLDAPAEGAELDGLVLVTGGARGVTADCAVALAEAGAPVLLLVGRSPLPDPEPDWLSAADDEPAVNRALLTHGFPKNGKKPTPKVLRERVRRVLGGREIRGTLARIEATGATAIYTAADVRDAKALEKAIKKAERATKHKLRGVLHGAGVLRDKLIVDKSDDDLQAVLSTKVDGLRALLGAVGGRELAFLGLFTSVTGRFGRRGQADYAAANRVLDALASREAARRPSTRVIAWSWGPWDGGMVTASLKKAFEAEGVALIPRDGGARVCAQEVRAAPGRAVQIVVGDGLDAGQGSAEPVPMPMPVRLDPDRWTSLRDHRLDGQPVLPLALGMELLGRAARGAFPEHALVGLEDVRVLKGVVLERAVHLLPVCGRPVVGAESVSVPVELRDDDGRARVRGLVKLRPPGVTAAEAPAASAAPEALMAWPGGMSTVYGEALFHGPAFQCIEEVHGTWDGGIALRVQAAPPPDLWLAGDRAAGWSVDPLVVDGIFQALILWCRAAVGAPSLPSRVASWEVFGPIPTTVELVATVRRRRGANVLADIDVIGPDGALVARMEGYTCTAAASLDRAFTVPAAGGANARA